MREEVSDFIDFLYEKSQRPKKVIIPQPGSAKGKIWMSPDFDEPLEEFKNYM